MRQGQGKDDGRKKYSFLKMRITRIEVREGGTKERGRKRQDRSNFIGRAVRHSWPWLVMELHNRLEMRALLPSVAVHTRVPISPTLVCALQVYFINKCIVTADDMQIPRLSSIPCTHSLPVSEMYYCQLTLLGYEIWS